MEHPYKNLDEKCFWKKAVSCKNFDNLKNFFTPKFPIPKGAKIAVAGSCFAQNVATFIRKIGYDIFDVEPAPPFLYKDKINLKNYGYGIYSARYGNIYTVRQLRQLIEESCERDSIRSIEEIVWFHNNRYYDGLRPAVFKNGFYSIDELVKQREFHLDKIHKLFSKADIFIFTLGLTESWVNKKTGLVYPLAPGVICEPKNYQDIVYINFEFNEIIEDIKKVIDILHNKFNPKLKIILTVSPVALAATMENRHVIVSNTYSKSILRAVAGNCAATMEAVDYFPSFDLLTAPISRYAFSSHDLRGINQMGINLVMSYFKSSYKSYFEDKEINSSITIYEDEIYCEESLVGEI